MERPAFLDQIPPPGYIPGIGRGAVGFSTRGSKKINKNNPIPKRLINSADNDEMDIADVEANNIFSDIDKRLANRNKKITTTSQSIASERNSRNSKTTHFRDLKYNLADVSNDQWLNLPEATDITRRNKRQRLEEQLNRKFYAAPDSLISQTNSADSAIVNLSKLTEDREKLLGTFLDSKVIHKQENDVTEIEEYLIALDKTLEQNIGNDVSSTASKESTERMRAILSSYRKSDARNPDSWIASARLEKKSRNFKLAQKLIEEGCRNCPKSENIWLENVDLNEKNSQLCKVIITNAIKYNPESLKLWTKAIELENETYNKQILVKKAIKKNPYEETLWKLAAQYEPDKYEVVKILNKAVEIVPSSIDLWSDLINLLDYPEAKRTLDKAKDSLPKDYRIWVLTIKIEEKFNQDCTINDLTEILQSGIEILLSHGISLPLDKWFEEAQILEKEGRFLKSVEAIIINSLNAYNFNASIRNLQEDIKKMDTSFCKIICLKYILKINPGQFNVWTLLKITCEKMNRLDLLYLTFETVLFDKKECNNSNIIREYPLLCLMYAKEIWKSNNDAAKAIAILNSSISLVPGNADIWSALLKIVCHSGQLDEANKLFTEAIDEVKSINPDKVERLYYKHINFLRFRELNKEALEILQNVYLKEFPKNLKLNLQHCQINCELQQFDEACRCLTEGIKLLPNEPKLSIALSEINELQLKKIPIARTNLDLALINNPNSSELLVSKIHLEQRCGNIKQANFIISQGLQKFPNDIELWVRKLNLVSDQKSITKKDLFQDALRNTKNNYKILLEIGISFFNDLQYTTSLKWIERSIKIYPKHGDSWIWLSRCYIKLKKPLNYCYQQVTKYEPIYGKEWIKISKGISTQYLDEKTILNKCLGIND